MGAVVEIGNNMGHEKISLPGTTVCGQVGFKPSNSNPETNR